MANVPYDYIDQDIVSTALILPFDDDSFYNPTANVHTGFAADGTHYTAGVQDSGPVFASWYTEFNPNPNSVLVSIADIQIASNIVTITTSIDHNFIVNQSVYVTNVGAATFLDQALLIVLSITANTITAVFTHANYSLTADTGTVSPSPYRGEQQAFPNSGLILLSKVAMTLLDQTNRTLPLWMQFLLGDNYAMANNFNGLLNGWTPRDLSYSDGVISIIYTPDLGSVTVTSTMIVSIDFVQDSVYLDVAT